jgi:predicted acyl esterase
VRLPAIPASSILFRRFLGRPGWLGSFLSRYVTQGILRASHRELGTAPFASFGLPWHTHSRKDLQPIAAGKALELVFDLLPTAFQFTKDSRIRIAVAFADVAISTRRF